MNNLTVIVFEDSSVVITLSGEDIDGDSLVYSISSLLSNGTVELEGDEVIYTPNVNFNGSDSFTYTASDAEYTSAEGLVNITVSQVDDPPFLAAIPDTSIFENEIFLYTIVGSDVDGDEVIYFAQSDGNSMVEVLNEVLTVTPYNNFNGEIQVTLTISDGLFEGSESFVLTVLPVNDSPELAPISDQTVLEDTEFTIDLTASDSDDEELSFSADTNNGAEVSIDGNSLTILPELNFNGDILVTVTVTDGEYSDSETFTLTVDPVNDAPELLALSDTTINEGETIEIILLANDIDGDGCLSGNGTISSTFLGLQSLDFVRGPNHPFRNPDDDSNRPPQIDDGQEAPDRRILSPNPVA